MPSNRCCVLGCDSFGNVPKKQFPKIDDDFKAWVERTGNPNLKNITKDNVIKKYLICLKHFDESCRSPGTNRLKFRSLPTLNLPSTYLRLMTCTFYIYVWLPCSMQSYLF